jgi:hypothetical protein
VCRCTWLLQVASYHMFLAGAFSSDPSKPHQVDADGLKRLTEAHIRVGFQVDDVTNPLVGVTGRTELLQRLGEAVTLVPEYFSCPAVDGFSRPGMLSWPGVHPVYDSTPCHVCGRGCVAVCA